jgi:hypothetical protein
MYRRRNGKNLLNKNNVVDVEKQNELEQKHERPGKSVDMFIVLLMIFSVVGLFIFSSQLRLSDGSLITEVVVLLVQLILMGTILNSTGNSNTFAAIYEYKNNEYNFLRSDFDSGSGKNFSISVSLYSSGFYRLSVSVSGGIKELSNGYRHVYVF